MLSKELRCMDRVGWGQGCRSGRWQMRVQRLKDIAQENGRVTLPHIEIAPQFVACIDKSHAAASARFKKSQMYQHLVSLSGTTLKDQVKAGN